MIGYQYMHAYLCNYMHALGMHFSFARGTDFGNVFLPKSVRGADFGTWYDSPFITEHKSR